MKTDQGSKAPVLLSFCFVTFATQFSLMIATNVFLCVLRVFVV
jgi:hypothetical protein